MSLEIKSTKKFKYLPCAHAQFFDREPDGTPGECASLHGYDREVEITFGGTPDEMGWIVAFGDATKPIKKFIEYYFDHVSVLPANDPRIEQIPSEMLKPGAILGTLKVLPSGVSMEMSSAFIWEHVNAYVHSVTQGRCYVNKVQVFEHDRNSGILEVEKSHAFHQARVYLSKVTKEELLPLKPVWDLETPDDLMKRLISTGFDHPLSDSHN